MKRYIEPFVGSACLFFRLQPERAILSDINGHLVRTYRTVRHSPDAVAESLRRYQKGREAYLQVRATSPWGLNSVERAARFIFLNRYCFNGLYRTNSRGRFNVPFAAARTGPLPDGKHLREAADALKVAKLQNTDFEEVIAEAAEGDFVYLDPPYAVGNRRLFRQYDPASFGLDDLDRLARQLRRLHENGAKFLLSYAICKEAEEHFAEWTSVRVYVQRNISGFAKHRRRAGELLISNYYPGHRQI